MKEGIGFTATINIITIFIVVTFGFLAATLSYYKAYKVNNAIADSIEKYEGYNDLAKTEISQKLAGLGYSQGNNLRCNKNNTTSSITTNNDTPYDYCIVYQEGKNNYYNYKIITYLRIDIPVVNLVLPIEIKSTTENIYYFSEG